MGNQSSLASSYGAAAAAAANRPAEPLDSFRRERARDEHLRNLGFKRSKSLRRSISKRLKRRKHKKEEDAVPPPTTTEKDDEDDKEDPNKIETKEEVERPGRRAASVERLDLSQFDPEVRKKAAKVLVGEPQPMPSHVQVKRDSGRWRYCSAR